MVQFKYAWLIDAEFCKRNTGSDNYGVFEVNTSNVR